MFQKVNKNVVGYHERYLSSPQLPKDELAKLAELELDH